MAAAVVKPPFEHAEFAGMLEEKQEQDRLAARNGFGVRMSLLMGVGGALASIAFGAFLIGPSIVRPEGMVSALIQGALLPILIFLAASFAWSMWSVTNAPRARVYAVLGVVVPLLLVALSATPWTAQAISATTGL